MAEKRHGPSQRGGGPGLGNTFAGGENGAFPSARRVTKANGGCAMTMRMQLITWKPLRQKPSAALPQSNCRSASPALSARASASSSSTVTAVKQQEAGGRGDRRASLLPPKRKSQELTEPQGGRSDTTERRNDR